MVFQFRAVSPNTTSSAQAALMTTWQSCDCYLLPVNGPFLCLISFTYGFAPLSFFSLFFYFPVYFSILAFSSFFAFFLFHSLLLFFLFIGKASLEPADYPRVLGYKKRAVLNRPRTKDFFDWTYVCARHGTLCFSKISIELSFKNVKPFRNHFTGVRAAFPSIYARGCAPPS